MQGWKLRSGCQQLGEAVSWGAGSLRPSLQEEEGQAEAGPAAVIGRGPGASEASAWGVPPGRVLSLMSMKLPQVDRDAVELTAWEAEGRRAEGCFQERIVLKRKVI